MANIDTRIKALEARSGRGTQDIVVIDEDDGPFMVLMQGNESLQDFERQVASVRSLAVASRLAPTPTPESSKADRPINGRSQ
jgi:hypothetical protein